MMPQAVSAQYRVRTCQVAVYKEGWWNHSMLVSFEECMARLDPDSLELSILEDCAYVCSLLSQRKCHSAGVGGEYSFKRAGNEHTGCRPASRPCVTMTRAF